MSVRVTPKTMQQVAIDGLTKSLAKTAKLQEQLASGKALNRPSDSPIETVSAMQYRSEIRRTEQYQRNAEDGTNWLGIADNTLTGVLESIGRVRELVIRGKNGNLGDVERGNIAQEIAALKDSLVGQANAKYLDRPIFGGNSGSTQAYDAAGVFQGSADDAIERRVGPGLKVRVNVTGPEVFGTGNGVDGNIFELVQKIADDLRTNPSGLDADLANLDNLTVGIQNQLGAVGARYNQVESMKQRASDLQTTLANGLSDVENIDLPRTIVDLQLQEVAYQSALSATAKVIQPSLLDFLR
jgi:flagellar hook-associated protein 3 FlgL